MSLKCGIIGLPNVGKSTIFNCLTRSEVSAENYPFCTIDPNVGIVDVPDQRLLKLKRIVKPNKTIPASVEFVDIAGLVKGASSGEGLGNKFLSNIRETDALVHVVRFFENNDIIHVNGKIDPISDIEIINYELILSDLSVIEKNIKRTMNLIKSNNDKKLSFLLELFEHIKTKMSEGISLRRLNFTIEEREILKSYNFLSMKPVLYAINISEKFDFQNDQYKDFLKIIKKDDSKALPICASLEMEILSLNEDEKLIFLDDLKMKEPGLNRLIRGAYELLGLSTFFTAGEKELRAWTIRHGFSAPEAAGVIHTDFKKGFIKAEVISYDDYINHNGEVEAKEMGKLRIEGKDYIVEDGDIIHFRFNV